MGQAHQYPNDECRESPVGSSNSWLLIKTYSAQGSLIDLEPHCGSNTDCREARVLAGVPLSVNRDRIGPVPQGGSPT